MTTLTCLPWWIVFPVSLVAVGLVTALARVVLIRFLHGDHARTSAVTAGALMTGFGAVFAFLSAFVITTEWSEQTAAESAVAQEASASARLAWAATSPGIDTEAIQGALADYLEEAIDDEFSALADGETMLPTTGAPYRQLERSTREVATDPDTASPVATEMLSALDDLAASRRERLTLANRTIPAPLFVVLVLSGLALCINAMVLTLAGSRRTLIVAASIVVLVGLDLGLVLVIGSPFRGSVRAESTPLDTVAEDLDDGWFSAS